MGGDNIKCMIGGSFACGLTHTAIVPLDVVKFRRQVFPTLYESLGDGLSTIGKTEGFGGLTLAWEPTFLGYSLQGLGKYGFYEIFKDVYKGIVGEENANKYKIIGSGSAEIIADTFLCPMEAIKCKLLNQEHLQQVEQSYQTQLNQMKVLTVFIKDQDPFWLDKFHILLSNSWPSNKSFLSSTRNF